MEKDLKAQNAFPLTAMYAGTFILVSVGSLGRGEGLRVFRPTWSAGAHRRSNYGVRRSAVTHPAERLEASIGVLATAECLVGTPKSKYLRKGSATVVR